MSDESFSAEARVHLLAIRKALSNRNAAVMVGAGFSRNAEGGENLATWRQLSEALAGELEPDREAGTFSPAAAAQLAEQYSRVFSPTHLEQLIKRCVPDDQVTPGPLHKALLELPWSEVFTTNYDTLLERAAERMFEVSYFTVCSREDIPQSKVLGRRRIVKLHGSFPSHRPFILTEEEYRTYPEKFAPFVNLVRQSLLENVFCLIGFSGDDPNFLHWLGWVRDMLDKHALPVYLFLADEPTLGERKLYEARGVVPVLLPIPAGIARNDYQARYRALFDELKRPLSNSPLDWGGYLRPTGKAGQKGDEEEFAEILNQLPALNTYRGSYPGWIVAPQEVRNRFRSTGNWLEGGLAREWIRELLGNQPSAVILSVIELYCWTQHVMLGPISDDLADMGRKALLTAGNQLLIELPEESVKFLKAMGIDDAISLRRTWMRLAIVLLTWARQSHRTTEYDEINEQLQPIAREDSAVQDKLIYEDALRKLQGADRRAALEIVSNWRPKSSDAYIHVLRGSLMAEVSEPSSAMPILEHAIQTLRRQQRSRPGDPALISKEAWACLVARHVQDAMEFSRSMGWAAKRGEGSNGDEKREDEDFDNRLNALVARGYSAREELSTVLAKLNAEAEPPTLESRRSAGFGLGESSSHRLIGAPSELREKIGASFAWLELVERIGLPPRTRNAFFFADEMLQAAWWARFADTPERSIGLLLRANRRDSLKPRERSRPPHRTGWLGRHEVAQLRETAAAELSSELMQQLVFEFDGSRPASESSSRVNFLIETFGRLVIRVQDEALLVSWGEQLLNLHRTTAFQLEPMVWESTAKAIGRVLEALPSYARLPLLFQAFSISLIPASAPWKTFHEHQLDQWLNPSEVARHCSRDDVSSVQEDWGDLVSDLIRSLQAPSDDVPIKLVWRRLGVLREVGLLENSYKREIGNILWSGLDPGKWPNIPGEHSAGTLCWPAPRRDAASLLLDKLLARPLRPFSGGYMEFFPAHKRRSYSIGSADVALGQIQFALGQMTPTILQLKQLFGVIAEWMDFELSDLVADADEIDVSESVALIVGCLDRILTLCVQQLSKRKRVKSVDDLIRQVMTIDARLKVFPFERFNLSLALIKSGDRGLAELSNAVRTIVRSLGAEDAQTSLRAFRAAYALLEDDCQQFRDVGRIAFDAVVSCAFGQRTNCLSRALNLLAHLSGTTWKRYLDEKSLLLIDALLVDLASSLAYEQRPSTASISEESVPLVRFNAFQLAYAITEIAGADSEAARNWLKAAKNDPLPEIRLERFRVNRK